MGSRPFNYTYKSPDTIPFLYKVMTQRWRLRSTRRRALYVLQEVQVLRQRLSQATVECSEWRAKVGEAAYSLPGPEFAKLAEDGIRNRIGTWLTITDEDLYAGE